MQIIVENNGIANQIMNDTIRGIQFVKSMLLERKQIEKIDAINNNTVNVLCLII